MQVLLLLIFKVHLKSGTFYLSMVVIVCVTSTFTKSKYLSGYLYFYFSTEIQYFLHHCVT